MRDPARIKTISDRLMALWARYPDLRLGQLIGNVVQDSTLLYYMEDEELLTMMEEFYDKISSDALNKVMGGGDNLE